jgi:hypothetical protein
MGRAVLDPAAARSPRPGRLRAGLALVVGAGLAACGAQGSGSGTFAPPRVVHDPEGAPRFDATEAQRFGLAGETATSARPEPARPSTPNTTLEDTALEDAALEDAALHDTVLPRDGTPSATGAAAEGAGDLRFVRPASWVRAADRPLRLLTLHAGPGGRVECSLSVLGGDGGGIRANFDRWRGQLGQGPLSDAEFAALEPWPMLGREGRRIEIAGDYRGMGSEAVSEALLLGAVCALGDRTVFVKLVGPRDLAAAERERFAAFCRSLELAP